MGRVPLSLFLSWLLLTPFSSSSSSSPPPSSLFQPLPLVFLILFPSSLVTPKDLGDLLFGLECLRDVLRAL